MRLIGCVMMILCGAGCGAYISSIYLGRTETLVRTADMLLTLSIRLEYEAPTVDEMIADVAEEYRRLPFLAENTADRDGILEALKNDSCGLEKADRERLAEFFMRFGSADRLSEQNRISAARAYFLQRIESERPENEKHAALSRRLGLLGGIFAAVMLL